MAIKKMPISLFVQQLGEAYERGDGYIMGATGQNPRRWKENSHWFTQYRNAKQRQKALYWREHAARVWDCNGLAEGIYKDYSGVSIDTQAKYNYRNWCDPKGTGLIPPRYRVAGAAVFWGSSASEIHHVAFLYKPVKADDPEGDWYLIEARGVMVGVVETKLLSREPNFWGLMTKYFDYGGISATQPQLGDRTLQNGMSGDDVRQMQEDLIRLGYDLGRWGADGDFGDATEAALRKFQKAKKLKVTGQADADTCEALEAAVAKLDAPVSNPGRVRVRGGNCYVRKVPSREAEKLGVARDGEVYPYAGQTTQEGWIEIEYKGGTGWISGKYGMLVK